MSKIFHLATKNGRTHWSAPTILFLIMALILIAILPAASAQDSPTATPPIWPTAPESVPPSATPPPTPTLFPSPPPAASLDPRIALTATLYPFLGTYTPPAQTPVYNVPAPVPMRDVDNDALVNVLLLGSDTPDNYFGRTDVLVLVSINTQTKTAAMWRIPRHLFVYIPNYTLDLINTIYARAEADDYPGGALALLQETFRYNFGIEIDHFARVNFAGFMQLIKALGWLEISVDCAIQDWRLIDPDLDPTVEENWEMFTLGVGQSQLSPYMALWYVRSRKSTDELDRGRRQMDVLRALWQQIKAKGLLAQTEALWPNLSSIVHTDMTFADMLPLIPLATDLELSDVARYSGSPGLHYTRTYTPDNGREILLPNREYLLPMLDELLTPATPNRLSRANVSVQVIDASWFGIGLERVAADRLAWEGFYALPLDGLSSINRELTVIYDYTGQTKGSALPDLQRVLRVGPDQVIRQPNSNRVVDYRVEIGSEYRLCKYGNAEDEVLIEPVAADELLEDLPISACWLRFKAQVNIRSGPGTAYDILDTVTPNDHVPVTGRTLDGNWWRVDDDGETGWVSAGITNVQLSGDCSSVPAVESP